MNDDTSREDVAAARSVNDARRLLNLTPVGTVSTAGPTVHIVTMADGERCECSCQAFCIPCQPGPQDAA